MSASTACAIAALLLISSSLTGCLSAWRESAVSRRLYQPSVLRLPTGQDVRTKDGLYRPQVDEVWHSDARYRDLEHAYIDAIAANAALSDALNKARP